MRLIDADHVLTLEEMQKMFTGETCCMKSSIQRVLSLFPTVDALPVMHAHWENIGGGHAECSNCGMTVSADYPASPSVHYCAKCGAKMDGKENKHETDRCR